ncbi:hypothetical protein C7E18_03170 [Stenotrophomonas maltophilia]|nr:hypothetical protein C7E18_03170 [Stenotrophomonas maltophilia]
MQDEIRIVVYGLGTLCLLAFLHLQLSAWLIPSWVRAFYVPGGRWRTAGIALQALAWVAAVAITIAGVAMLLSWMPGNWGWTDEVGAFTPHADDLSTWAGVFMGSGWIWSLLQAGRRKAGAGSAQQVHG